MYFDDKHESADENNDKDNNDVTDVNEDIDDIKHQNLQPSKYDRKSHLNPT